MTEQIGNFFALDVKLPVLPSLKDIRFDYNARARDLFVPIGCIYKSAPLGEVDAVIEQIKKKYCQ